MLQRSAVILTYKKLVDQFNQMLFAYRVHFHIRPDIRVLAYETLSSPKGAKSLELIRPGIVLADESQAVAGDSVRTSRFRKFFDKFPDTIYCPFSGSHGKRSVKDYVANINIALGEGSPLPRTYNEIEEWSEALDVSDYPRPPGKLRMFCQDQETVQEGYARRFLNTRGVVASEGNDPGVKLNLHLHMPPNVPEISDAVAGIEDTWERPDGEIFLYAMEVARAVQQIRLGGYYRWNWKAIGRDEPDQEWLEARRDYARDVRDFVKRRKDGLDSPGLIKVAHLDKDLGFASWPAWDRVRHRPMPPTEWIWISKARLEWACNIIKAAPPCIAWTDVTSFAFALAKRLGVKYYGRGEQAGIDILKEDGSRTIVASIRAHGTGRNLQAYNRGIIVGGSGNGEEWEQLLGRMHRTGQQRDVQYDVLFPYELENAKRDALWKASMAKDEKARFLTRAPQKLLTCTYSEERIKLGSKPR